MEVGDTTQLAGYSFVLAGLREIEGPNYVSTRAVIEVLRGTAPVTVMFPEKRLYTVQNMPMTEAAIDANPLRHLYVSLGEQVSGPNQKSAWLLKFQYKPLVGWIWGGCLLMALGGILAATDRRYRVGKRQTAPAQNAANVAAAAAGR